MLRNATRNANHDGQVRVTTVALAVVATIASVTAQAIPVLAGAPQNPFGRYQETVTDLSVKVLGGFVSVQRTWHGLKKRWIFSPKWQNLVLSPAADGLPAVIHRGDVIFERQVGNSAPLWVRKGAADRITYANDVYRWSNIRGDWMEFDTAGRMVSFGDRNITIATVVRDEDEQILGILDHNGLQVLTFEYTNATLTRAFDYTNRQVTYAYDGPDLVSVTDVRGNPWGYTYSNGNLTTKTDAEGRVTTVTYAVGGVLKSIRDEAGFGADYRYSYDSNKRQYYTYSRRSGNVINETWTDENGKVVRRDLNGRTIFTRRRNGNDLISKDEHGNETRRRYDASGRLIGTLYPDGSTTAREVTGFGGPDATVDENGVRTEYEHDTHGNIIRITEAVDLPEERVTEQAYDELGQRASVKQIVDRGPADRITEFEYDAFGNMTKVTDAEGHVIELAYDVLGQVAEFKNQDGEVWVSTYDNSGARLRTVDPLTRQVNYEFDKVGNLVRYVDQAGEEYRYTYDDRNLLTKILDPSENPWLYEYYDSGLVRRQVDPEGHAVEYRYDRDGRLTSLIDNSGDAIAVTYSANSIDGTSQRGRVDRVTYPTFTRERHYNSRNRLVAKVDIDRSGSRLTTRYSYDGVGHQLAIETPDGRVSVSQYDALRRLAARTLTDARTITFERDSWDQNIRFVDPSGHAMERRFDKVGRRVVERRPGGGGDSF